MGGGAIAGIVIAGLVVIFLVTMLILLPRKPYFMAMFSGCYISAFKLIAMKLRKVDVMEVVNAYVLSKKSHLGVALYNWEIVYVSGGHPLKIVEGLNAAKTANIPIDFNFIKAVDISGRDPLDVVRECINPKLIELPLVSSVAQNKIEVNAKVSLTLKVNLKKYLTGASEDTISARAVEAIVTKIANTKEANELVSRPELLDKTIFDANVDEDSKYILVSADVIHIGLGNNHNFADEKEQIEKSRLLDYNQMEHRRLLAVAVEQEMRAKAEEAKIRLIEEQTNVTKSVIKAIEEGKITDVLDYYKMENLQADTEMIRSMLSKNSKKNNK